MSSRICALAALIVVCGGSVGIARAQTIRFDAPGYIEGRECSTTEFRSLHPSETLIEFNWEIAADLGVSGHDEVSALSIRLRTASPDATIVDYCPRTQTDSEIDGTIQVAQVDETNASLGIQGGSGTSFPWNASASAGIGGKNSQSVKYEKRPEQLLLVSSGLMDRGTGLSIRLRKTPQHPLDGMHPIRLVLRVPANWRTGFLRLECEAISRKPSRLSDESFVTVGKRSFLLPMLIEGDEEARLRARAIEKAERVLRSAVIAQSNRKRDDNLLDYLAQWSQQDKRPRLDSDWLDRVVEAAPSGSNSSSANLPRDVALALKDYARLRQAFSVASRTAKVESVAAQTETRSGQHSNERP